MSVLAARKYLHIRVDGLGSTCCHETLPDRSTDRLTYALPTARYILVLSGRPLSSLSISSPVCPRLIAARSC
jgi:hypothetical protein